jgi:predicted nucleotidyltransferase
MNLDLSELAELAAARLPHLLFVTVSGAHLYGFPSEDSDIDLRGAHLAPLGELIGLHPPQETREAKLEQRGREVELVSHELGKYLRLMTRNNGYILEQVFSPLVVRGEEFLQRLRPLARRCVTRECAHHYRGFLQGRIKLLEKEEVKKTKSLLYAYRVVLTGIHLLQTGEVEANLPALNRRFGLPFLEELIRWKQAREQGGLPELDWQWHRAELARWEKRLNQAYAESTLPEKAPREDVNTFLVEFRLQACNAP